MPTETVQEAMLRHVTGFVESSGGEPVLGLLKNAIRVAHEAGKCQDMLAQIAENENASEQLLACAMMGICLSLEIARKAEKASTHH